MSVAEHKKVLDHLAKAVGKLQGDQAKLLDHLEEQREESIVIYRLFDKLAKKLKKPTATEADDKAGLQQIDAWIKDGGRIFTAMKSDLAGADKLGKEASKMVPDLAELIDGLKEQANGKSADKGKFKGLHDDARKLLEKVRSDIVKHRGDAYDPEREQKDFVKELNKFAALVASGKHRDEKEEDADDWKEGILETKKIAEITKKLKLFEARGTRALDAISVALTVARKGEGTLDIKAEQKEMAEVLAALEKLHKGLRAAFVKIPRADLDKAKGHKEMKDLQALMKQMPLLKADLDKRYRAFLVTAVKLAAEQKKAEKA